MLPASTAAVLDMLLAHLLASLRQTIVMYMKQHMLPAL